MASASGHEEHKCSNCPKSASHICKACRNMPNDTDGKITSTWYCGAKCQSGHWDEHKARCKAARARQALYRAGSVAKQMFYLYLEHCLMWSPGHILKIGTTWYIYPRVYTGTSQLMPFPYDTIQDSHEQEAVRTLQSCNTALSEMHDIFKVLLKGKSTIFDILLN